MPKVRERKIKPFALEMIQKSIKENETVSEWFVYMVFKDGLPFYCEADGNLANEQVIRMNKDSGFGRYQVRRVKVGLMG